MTTIYFQYTIYNSDYIVLKVKNLNFMFLVIKTNSILRGLFPLAYFKRLPSVDPMSSIIVETNVCRIRHTISSV